MAEEVKKTLVITTVNDDELDALSFCLIAVRGLDQAAAKRVVSYLADRLGDKELWPAKAPKVHNYMEDANA